MSPGSTSRLFDATQFRRPVVGATEIRLLAYPRVSYPIVRPGLVRSRRRGLHLSNYRLDNPAVPEQTTPNWCSVPVFSLDAGLVFERNARSTRG